MTVETISGGRQRVAYHSPDDILDLALADKALPRGLSELELKIKGAKSHEDDLSEEAVKQGITNWVNRFSKEEGKIVARYYSLITLDLTDEELSKALNFTGGRNYHVGGIGYVDPERIQSHFCTECDKEYDGAPKIEVFIGVLPSGLEGEIGKMIGVCNVCEDPVISTCPVWEGQTPDVKYISADYSGKFIPIKPEDIEEQLKKARKHAEENGNLHCRSLGIAEKLAKNSGHNIEDKLAELKEFAEKRDLELYEQNLSEKVNEIHGEWDDFYCRDLSFKEDEHYGVDQHYASFMEEVRTLVEKVSKITISDEDDKEKIKQIIDSYRNDVFDAEIKNLDKNIKQSIRAARELKKERKDLPKIE